MLTLTLLRHAKSSWDNKALDDFDRPLSSRGQKAAPIMARALAARGPNVDLILCSPARRTMQTCELILPELTAPTPEVLTNDRLYHALPDMLIDVLQDLAGTAQHVVLIGHNPGLEILATRLTDQGPSDAISAMTRKFPTAAAAQLTFEIKAWADLRVGTGTLRFFLTPRSLD